MIYAELLFDIVKKTLWSESYSVGFWGVVAIPPPPKCHTVAFLQHPPCDILTTVAEKTQCDIATTLCFYLGILRKLALSNHT